MDFQVQIFSFLLISASGNRGQGIWDQNPTKIIFPGEFESKIQFFFLFLHLNVGWYKIIFVSLFLLISLSLFCFFSSHNVQRRKCSHPVSSNHVFISRGEGHHDLQCQLKCKLHALVPAEVRHLPQTMDLWNIQTGFWSPSSLQWQWVWDLLLSHNQQHGGWRCCHLLLPAVELSSYTVIQTGTKTL